MPFLLRLIRLLFRALPAAERTSSSSSQATPATDDIPPHPRRFVVAIGFLLTLALGSCAWSQARLSLEWPRDDHPVAVSAALAAAEPIGKWLSVDGHVDAKTL